MTDYKDTMVSSADLAKMEKDDYYTLVNRAYTMGYDMEADCAYNGEERYCG